jgi:hypothetical protein
LKFYFLTFFCIILNLQECKLDIVENNKYNHNIEIMNKLTISQANIIKYIKLTNNDSIIEATKKILKLNPNMLVKDFIKNFLKEYDKTCSIKNFVFYLI